MKKLRNLGRKIKQHNREITTAAFFVGVLMTSGYATATEPSTVGNFHHEVSHDLAVRVPDARMNLAMLAPTRAAAEGISTYPEKAMKKATIQLFSDMPMTNLQTGAFAATFLHHHALNDGSHKQAGLGVNEASSWIMFSW